MTRQFKTDYKYLGSYLSLEEVQSAITEITTEYPEVNAGDVSLCLEYPKYEDERNIHLVFQRYETLEEENIRTAREREMNQNRREQYERLRKEFEGK